MIGHRNSYLVRPSPFSAQKTFERHNSRRKSNISFCSQNLLQQMGSTTHLGGSRRGSGLGLSGYQAPRPPPLVTTKSNSLSLPDSPTVATHQRGRSNSLRVIDDILLRRLVQMSYSTLQNCFFFIQKVQFAAPRLTEHRQPEKKKQLGGYRTLALFHFLPEPNQNRPQRQHRPGGNPA